MEKTVSIFRHGEDPRTAEPLTVEAVMCCRAMRDCGMGRFLNKRTFRLFRPKATVPIVTDRDFRGTSAMIDTVVIEAYCSGEHWAIEAVHSWAAGRA
jgi:hypothetical protein